MPLTPEEIDAKLRAPKTVTIDGNTATQWSAEELKLLQELSQQSAAVVNKKPPIRMYKLVPPGSV